LFLWCLAALKWCSEQGSCIFGWHFCLCLFCGCSGVSGTSSLDCSSASDAMDWIAFDVWMDIHNFLYIIWRLYPFDLSVGKNSGITRSIFLVTAWVWLWFRKTYVLKSKASFVVVFHLIVMLRYFFLYILNLYVICIYRSSATDIILWCCYMVLWFRDGPVGHCSSIVALSFWNYCLVFKVIYALIYHGKSS